MDYSNSDIFNFFHYHYFLIPFFEKPLRNIQLSFNKIGIIGIGLISIIFSGSLIKYVINPNRSRLFLAEYELNSFSDARFVSNINRCTEISKDFREYKNIDYYAQFFDKCWLNLDGSLEKKDNLNKKLFIFGNSYNQMQYSNYAEALLERKNLGINSFITRSCTVSTTIRARKGKDINKACSNLLENYISF